MVSARTSRWRRLIDQTRHAVISLLAEADRGLRLAVAALCLVVIVATAVLMIGYRKPDGAHMSLLDGVYFSVETIGTIGYGDFYFANQAAWLRVFAIGLMISGVLLAAIFFALLTNLLVSRRLEESLGRRAVGGMSEHVIVVGLGSIGLRVVERILAEGTAVVVVERDENNRYLAQARGLGVPVIVADATLRRTLQDVNLGTARAVAVLTSNDLTNIETGLAVRDALEQRWAARAGRGAAVRPPARAHDRDHLRLPARPLDRRLGRAVVRRSRARSGGPQHLLRRAPAVPAGPAERGRRRRSGRAADVTAVGTDPGDRDPPRRPARDGRGTAADSGLEHPPRRDTRFAAHDVAYLVGPYEELLQVLRRDGLSTSQLTSAPAPTGLAATAPVLGESRGGGRPIVG